VRESMTKIQETFMANLTRERQRRGLTQEKLAELCEISVNHLQSIEKGRRFPSPETFQTLADVLKVEPHRFLIDPEQSEGIFDQELLERYNDYIKGSLEDLAEGFRKSQQGAETKTKKRK
jgi:transcriptional regulator with XRE-family HTH domain